MEFKEYRAAIEAILFANGEPVSAERLAEVLELDTETVHRIAADLMSEMSARAGGVYMVKLDEQYQLCTRKEYADAIRRSLDIRRNTPLSQAAMEVLAIVAYNQPVTKAFIEQVRGVDCSAVIQGLTQKNLIEEQGRLELPGRPLLYGTTPVFLRCFGVSGVHELPPLPQKEEDARMVETTLEEIIEQSDAAEEIKEENNDGE